MGGDGEWGLGEFDVDNVTEGGGCEGCDADFSLKRGRHDYELVGGKRGGGGGRMYRSCSLRLTLSIRGLWCSAFPILRD